MNRSPIITILLGFSLLCAVYTNINIVDAQQGIPNKCTCNQESLQRVNTASTAISIIFIIPTLPTSSLNTKLHTVKIISPTKGQQVPVGKYFSSAWNKITGAAGNANGMTSHCQVSVIVNSIKPYQPATGAGPRRGADYSKWNFAMNSKYATIKPAPNNKIIV